MFGHRAEKAMATMKGADGAVPNSASHPGTHDSSARDRAILSRPPTVPMRINAPRVTYTSTNRQERDAQPLFKVNGA